MSNILEMNHIRTVFSTDNGIVQSTRDISLSLEDGEILGIVGESGSGKSVLMLSFMGLLATNGFIRTGDISFEGEKLLNLGEGSDSLEGIDFRKLAKEKKKYEKTMRFYRGGDVGMVFQDPMTFLNPVLTIGYQLTEGMRVRTHKSQRECEERALEMLKMVGVTSPERRLKQYPNELSGGMRQRIMIAMALMCSPRLLIADEPTTALDVTIQAQILELMMDLKKKLNMSIIMISHDLGVVASMCTRIIIMYGGQIMEEGTDRDIFYHPKHPYTMGLLKSVASGEEEEGAEEKKLEPIPGSPPDLLQPPKGCAFVDRCEKAMAICKNYSPEKTEFSESHCCRCWLYDQEVQRLLEGKEGS